METPKTTESCSTINIEHGLKALTICPENDLNHHNSCIMTSNLMSPPSSPSFSDIGDYIGMESCVDLKNQDDECVNMTGHSHDDHEASNSQRYRRKREKWWTVKKREIPPPISLLARTENLPSHMPFVLKRYYTSDGRLIIREEGLTYHEYFRVHRSNGNLTLQLVPLYHDDNILVDPCLADLQYKCDEQCNAEEEEEYLETGDSGDKCEIVDKNDNVHGKDDIEETVVEKYGSFESSVDNESAGNGGASKCLNCSSVLMSSSCFVGLPVPAIKTVHS